MVDGSGQLGVAPSSKRFKEQIKPMDNKSDTILALKPVTFHYKKQIDPKSTAQFGLVAEEVEKINPDLVVRDKIGAIYTVRYDAVNAMLLNEFLKEHRTVQAQGGTIAELKKQVAALTARLDEQASQI
jgi:trimeric autotransporter adhesin